MSSRLDLKVLMVYLKGLLRESNKSMLIFTNLKKQQQILYLQSSETHERDKAKIDNCYVRVVELEKHVDYLNKAVEEQKFVIRKQIEKKNNYDADFEKKKQKYFQLGSMIDQQLREAENLLEQALSHESSCQSRYQEAKNTRMRMRALVDETIRSIQDCVSRQNSIQSRINQLQSRIYSANPDQDTSYERRELRNLEVKLQYEVEEESQLRVELNYRNQNLHQAQIEEDYAKEDYRRAKVERRYRENRLEEINQIQHEHEQGESIISDIDVTKTELSKTIHEGREIINECQRIQEKTKKNQTSIHEELSLSKNTLHEAKRKLADILQRKISLGELLKNREAILVRSMKVVNTEIANLLPLI